MNNRFKTVNLSYLEEISGGDVIFQKELIGIFLNQIPEFLSNMQQFFSGNENEKLAKEAHTAKSSVLIFMMDETGKNLKQIQELAESGQMEQIPNLMARVKERLNEAHAELSQYLTQLEELSDVRRNSLSGW